MLCKSLQLPTPTTCTYSATSNTVTCGGISCATSNQFDGRTPLPKGKYYIGIVNTQYKGTTFWFNL